MESLSEANSQFSLDLFKKLSETNSGNIFFSPLNISTALAMVLLGARGNTAAQMEQVLHFSKIKTVHSEFSNQLSSINNKDSTSALRLANRLFGEKTLIFAKDYLDETRMLYHSEIEGVDFITSSESARQNINSWVEKQTEGKIINLLSEGTIDSMTRLLLVSAIYFQGDWQKKFRMDKTKEVQFRLNKKDTKSVMMMYKSAKFNYASLRDVDADIIELPYAGGDVSMFVLLPKDIEDDSTGLEQIEKQLTYENVMKWTSKENLHCTKMNLYLPRFKMEETYNLKKHLSSMGMRDVFHARECDLSGISSAKGLYVSEVTHKAFVDVNEEGTVAAAATAVKFKLLCYVYPEEFKADHPFIFFIKQNPSNSILFFGKVCTP
ncbi:leukocyte elastase inhibitor-like [Polypterus senegalus]|uniref:leukocyte elastase inhibitor-like n=1 Tax=Polypterus senegalus TaxID=55291 RepID=UPI001966A23F|nr:leukocyte elastase inhibitor-like [Polypterus senegalus]XP_039609389.1 leukocyte elastase inhibitor-like [Polypterus senegalus]